MCYSAQIRAEYKKYVRKWGADISLTQYFQLYWERRADAKIKIPRVMDAEFANPGNEDECKIKDAQPFFEDMCRPVDHPTPREADPGHEWFTYETRIYSLNKLRCP